MFYYLTNFLLFAIFGYFFETFMFLLLHIHNKSGFMYLPWTPFYGIGVILAIFVYNLLFKNNLNKTKKNIWMFTIFFFLFSFLEWLGGVNLEFLLGYYPWSYEVIPLHIGKYVSVGTSLLWASFAFFYLYVIKKFSDKIVKKIPKWITIVVFLIFIVDLILTLIKLFNIKAM